MDKLEEIQVMIEQSHHILLNAKRMAGIVGGWRKNTRYCKTYVEGLEKNLYYLENLIKEYNQ